MLPSHRGGIEAAWLILEGFFLSVWPEKQLTHIGCVFSMSPCKAISRTWLLLVFTFKSSKGSQAAPRGPSTTSKSIKH